MRRTLLLPILLFALVATAACSGDGGNGDGQQSDDPKAMVKFAQCMREHGQNVPDPDGESESYAITPPSGGPNAAWNAAMDACRQHLPAGGAPDAPNATELEAQRQYAKCMREHDIEMSDPDPNTGRSQIGGRLANATRDQLRADPGYAAAVEACKDKLPKAQE
jgi:hypothetical protein